MSKALILVVVFFFIFRIVCAQKGDISISVGPLVAFPEAGSGYTVLKTGIGLEGTGQYNFTDQSSILLQIQLTHITARYNNDNGANASIKGGYRYRLTQSGIYANILTGVEQDEDAVFDIAGALGAGKRFTIKNGYWIDAGIDYVLANISRVNLKAVFSILRRPKKNYIE